MGAKGEHEPDVGFIGGGGGLHFVAFNKVVHGFGDFVGLGGAGLLGYPTCAVGVGGLAFVSAVAFTAAGADLHGNCSGIAGVAGHLVLDDNN